jgi:peroxiredoxin
MNSNKIIFLRKNNIFFKNKKMLFVSIILGVFCGFIAWNFLIENQAALDVKIPQSKNITFNDKDPLAMTTAQVDDQFNNFDDKPILLYIYTTWCSVCGENFETFNEIAREFQETELKVFAIAIDKGLDSEHLNSYLNKFGNLYFQPRYLVFKEGFIDFLRKKNIAYNGRIPFTVLISGDGKIITKFSGTKNKKYLRNKIIKTLYQ